MSIGKEKKNDFINKINEAIVKLQKTLPKQLSDSDIESIRKLLDEYVTDTLNSNCGMRIDLNGLIYMANREGEIEIDEKELKENIPYLAMFITNDFLGIANHAEQYLYSTDDKYKITEDYFVKSHAQVFREYEAKNNGENGSHDEHDEQ